MCRICSPAVLSSLKKRAAKEKNAFCLWGRKSRLLRQFCRYLPTFMEAISKRDSHRLRRCCEPAGMLPPKIRHVYFQGGIMYDRVAIGCQIMLFQKMNVRWICMDRFYLAAIVVEEVISSRKVNTASRTVLRLWVQSYEKKVPV